MNSEKSRCVTAPDFREMQSVHHLPTRGPKVTASGIEWVKMTPMEWIDDLNAKAKAGEELNGSKTRPSATETPPPISAFAMPPSGEKRTREAFATGSYAQGGAWLQQSYPVSSLDTLPPEVAKLVSEANTTSMPLFWDLGCLQPSEQVEQIRLLVLAIEGQPKFMEMKPAFEQVRDHFTFSLSQCHATKQFEMLCQDTIARLQSLLVILVKNLQEGTAIGSSQSPTPCTSNGGNIRSSPTTPNKALFHSHMNNWLRANWINPYPDEAVSHQLAYETGETLHVVNTWLVNARSRRWRPAVLKAFELNRPSELLWEDSIALFEDKPLRSLDEQASASTPKRSRFN
jgi:hypothetical protein